MVQRILSRNSFDDTVFESKRLKRVMRGSRKQLSAYLRRFNRGDGDFESCCRAVSLLCEFYADMGKQVALCESVLHVCRMCLRLSPTASLKSVLDDTDGIMMSSGLVYAPALVAWCAVCEVRGAVAHDMRIMWRDNDVALALINVSCVVFENLQPACYTDVDLQNMSHVEN